MQRARFGWWSAGFNGGLFLVAVGALLPWARVAGEDRAGAAFANSLLALPEVDQARSLPILGLLWYLIPLLALALWLSQFRRWPPVADRLSVALAAALVVATGLYLLWLAWRGVGGPQAGAIVSLAGAGLALVSALVGRRPVPATGPRPRASEQ